MMEVPDSERLASLLSTPGGIYHWHGIFSAIAWKPAESFLVDLGFVAEAQNVQSSAAAAVERIDSELGDEEELRALSPAEFGARSAVALRSALEVFDPASLNSVVRLGAWSEHHGAQAFVWSIAIGRMARSEVTDTRSALPADRFEELIDWHATELALSDRLDLAVEAPLGTPAVLLDVWDGAGGTLDGLLRQARFDLIWTRIREWPQKDREALLALAQAATEPLGIADGLLPEQ